MISDTLTAALENGTVSMDEMTNTPGTNYTTILVLRELESHAVFTTNGQDADMRHFPLLVMIRVSSIHRGSCSCENRREATGGWGKQSSESYWSMTVRIRWKSMI